MELATWLAAKPGRASLMAAHFKVSRGAISQWKRHGVPLAHMKAVRAFTCGAVTLEEMVPDAAVTGGQDLFALQPAPT